MEGNKSLISAMQESRLTQAEFADAVNTHLLRNGYEGTVSDRTVRNWLTGKTRWPHPRQRAALEAIFGSTAEELGFIPPARRLPTAELEEPVKRRNFLTATTSTTAAVVVPLVARHSVGTSDVI